MGRIVYPNRMVLFAAFAAMMSFGCSRKVVPQMETLTLSLPSPANRVLTKSIGTRAVAAPVSYEVVIINVPFYMITTVTCQVQNELSRRQQALRQLFSYG